jgi:hypothetical protein
MSSPQKEAFRTVTKHDEYYIPGADLCLLVSSFGNAIRTVSYILWQSRLKMSNSGHTDSSLNANLDTLFAS